MENENKKLDPDNTKPNETNTEPVKKEPEVQKKEESPVNDDDDYEDIDDDEDDVEGGVSGDFDEYQDSDGDENPEDYSLNLKPSLDDETKTDDGTKNEKLTNKKEGEEEETKTPKPKNRLPASSGANPALTPVKKGNFYEHDNRGPDEESSKLSPEDEVKLTTERRRNDKPKSNEHEKWQHDKYHKHHNPSHRNSATSSNRRKPLDDKPQDKKEKLTEDGVTADVKSEPVKRIRPAIKQTERQDGVQNAPRPQRTEKSQEPKGNRRSKGLSLSEYLEQNETPEAEAQDTKPKQSQQQNSVKETPNIPRASTKDQQNSARDQHNTPKEQTNQIRDPKEIINRQLSNEQGKKKVQFQRPFEYEDRLTHTDATPKNELIKRLDFSTKIFPDDDNNGRNNQMNYREQNIIRDQNYRDTNYRDPNYRDPNYRDANYRSQNNRDFINNRDSYLRDSNNRDSNEGKKYYNPTGPNNNNNNNITNINNSNTTDLQDKFMNLKITSDPDSNKRIVRRSFDDGVVNYRNDLNTGDGDFRGKPLMRKPVTTKDAYAEYSVNQEEDLGQYSNYTRQGANKPYVPRTQNNNEPFNQQPWRKQRNIKQNETPNYNEYLDYSGYNQNSNQIPNEFNEPNEANQHFSNPYFVKTQSFSNSTYKNQPIQRNFNEQNQPKNNYFDSYNQGNANKTHPTELNQYRPNYQKQQFNTPSNGFNPNRLNFNNETQYQAYPMPHGNQQQAANNQMLNKQPPRANLRNNSDSGKTQNNFQTGYAPNNHGNFH